MNDMKQPEALRLAGMNEAAAHGYPAATVGYQLHTDTAAELRRLHAENESMCTAIKKLHSSRGRYHTQLAACGDLYDLLGLKNERPTK